MKIPEIEFCVSHGKNIIEAIIKSEIAIKEWIDHAKTIGKDIPKPLNLELSEDERDLTGYDLAVEEYKKAPVTLVYFDKGGKERCGFQINTPKTEAGERSIPMLPKVKEAFIMEKQFQEEIGLECKSIVDDELGIPYTDFIFVNRFGGVQHQGTLNKALRRIIRDCNYGVLDECKQDAITLPPFSNHSLRHTFTTRMCEANVNIKAMQDILGHADAETTLQIYADATKDLKKQEIISFKEYFDDRKKEQMAAK